MARKSCAWFLLGRESAVMSSVFFIQLSRCRHQCNNKVFVVFVHIDVNQH